MTKLVVLKLEGNFSQKTFVTLEIGEEGLSPDARIEAWLPEAPTLSVAYVKWREAYRHWGSLLSRVKPKKILHKGQISIMQAECTKTANLLREQLNQWLLSGSFLKIRDIWLKQLGSNNDETVRVLIRTTNPDLQKLPWQLWDLIEKQHNAEVALSGAEFEPPILLAKAKTKTIQERAKILAILGDSTGIDIESDRKLLQSIPGADPLFLPEPNRKELTDKLWEENWDVLFFAGHSTSDNDCGRIYLNSTEALTINDLKHTLRKAVSNGLQLAIFNSCDGMGLAQALADLRIPLVIVMREPVPDVVAQEFLKHFLKNYSYGQSLYASVREARERLERLEDEYPCATWLPMIYQNSPKQPITWNQLCHGFDDSKKSLNFLPKQKQEISLSPLSQHSRIEPNYRQLLLSMRFWKVAFVLSALTAGVVMGARYIGWLEASELGTFDQMQQLRTKIFPDEKQDSRILVVGITEDDRKLPQQNPKVNPRQGSLSDQALWLVLQKLTSAKAQVIGLDIYRDFPTKIKKLAKFMHESHRFVSVCKVRDRSLNDPGISPPPEIPLSSQGFSDTISDSHGNGILRRYLAIMTPPAGSSCGASYALSIQLAMRYLASKEKIFSDYKRGELRIGQVVLPRLEPHTGVYQQDDIWGYQSLLNYRYFQKSPKNFVQQVTLKQMLDGDVKAEDINQRIVLIGVTNFNDHDDIATPVSQGNVSERMFGVIAHAQMVSQVLSAAIDGRPLLRFWAWWEDVLWVFIWSFGSLLLWRFRFAAHLGLVFGTIVVVLYVSCFLLLVLNGAWVPFVPSVLALMGTSCIMVVWMYRLNHHT